MSAVQKSLIAETIQGARASLHEPSRPFTPGDLPRHLFQGDDYSNRPGSSYKINSVVGQAADEFRSETKRIGNQGTSSHKSFSTTASKHSSQNTAAANKKNLKVDSSE